MSYNSTLQSNNADLQAILDSINELPEAGREPTLQDKTVIPSTSQQTITADSGFDGLDTITVEAIPSQYIIPSGTLSIGDNGTYNVANYANAVVNVAGSSGGGLPDIIQAGDTPVLANMGVYSNNKTSLAATNLSLTIPRAGTYRFSWLLNGGDSAYSITVQGRLYQNGTAVGTLHSSNKQEGTLVTEDITCSAGDVMTVYLKRTEYWGTTYGSVCNLVASIDWDNGF